MSNPILKSLSGAERDKLDEEEMDRLIKRRDELKLQLSEIEEEIVALAQLMRLSR